MITVPSNFDELRRLAQLAVIVRLLPQPDLHAREERLNLDHIVPLRRDRADRAVVLHRQLKLVRHIRLRVIPPGDLLVLDLAQALLVRVARISEADREVALDVLGPLCLIAELDSGVIGRGLLVDLVTEPHVHALELAIVPVSVVDQPRVVANVRQVHDLRL